MLPGTSEAPFKYERKREGEGSISKIMSVVNTLDHTCIKNKPQFRPTKFIGFHDYMAHSSLPTLLIMNLLINLFIFFNVAVRILIYNYNLLCNFLRFKLMYP